MTDYPTPDQASGVFVDNGVVFDLDTVERPADQVVSQPFVVNIKGRPIQMIDPGELDFRDVLAMDNPSEFLRHAISAEDREFIALQDIPAWKFNALMERYGKHYRLEERQRAAEEQQRRRTQI